MTLKQQLIHNTARMLGYRIAPIQVWGVDAIYDPDGKVMGTAKGLTETGILNHLGHPVVARDIKQKYGIDLISVKE